MASRSLVITGLRSSLSNKNSIQSSKPISHLVKQSIVSPPTHPWSIQSRGKRNKAALMNKPMPHPSLWKDVEFPEATHVRADEEIHASRRLPDIPKVPEYTDWHRHGKPPKHSRDIINIRGPELVHNDLIHKQFGIVAEQGGFLRHEHFEMMKRVTDKMLEFDKMFCQYRVDPLYQSWTKKSTGQRMGGGKGSVHHYVTPIKEGRIILEVGGYCTYEEVLRCLKNIAHVLPFEAKPVSYETMISDAERDKYLESGNINPFTMDYCLKYNMKGCWRFMNYYDHVWKLKHD